MDRRIERKIWTPNRIVAVVASIAIIGTLTFQVLSASGKSRLRIDPTRITVSRVKRGEFLEYYPATGVVVPVTSVLLSLEQGGQVEEILAEGGEFIEKGELIVRLSNPTLARSFIQQESSLLETLDRAQNTQVSVERSRLSRKEQLLNLEYEIRELQKQHGRNVAMRERGGIVSEQEYIDTRDRLDYLLDRHTLLLERMEQESYLEELQLAQAKDSIERIEASLRLLAETQESLNVRAPIAGYLTRIDAQLGRNLNAGTSIGQIDIPDEYKIRISVDQYYISRVNVGTLGRFSLDGQTYGVEVIRKYTEVADNTFTVDTDFIGAPPPSLTTGQQLTIELQFGEPESSLMVSKGGFYQQTSGRWIYLIAANLESAVRQPIRAGRQNPRFVEILEGLREDDWVITSGYELFNEVDELIFQEPLQVSK